MPTALVDNELFVDFNEIPTYSPDSEGNLLTPEQKEFFSKSKCRDAGGLLYKVYHASSADYDAFDKNHIGSGSGYIYGKGFYFSCEADSVKIYGNNIKEYYLNLKNPFIYEAVDFEEDAEYNVDNFISILKHNNYPVSEDLRLALIDEITNNDGGLDTLIELTCGTDKANSFFKSCNFDGIINLDVFDFVAFEPNQIKLCSNLKPTNSELLAASFKRA